MSTTSTGWSILNGKGELINYGTIKNKDKSVFYRLRIMINGIENIINENNITYVVAEDVPVSLHSNLKTGKYLCVLQGALFKLCSDKNIGYKFLSPTHWRKNIGFHHSLITCKLCGTSFETITGEKNLICPNCKNTKKINFTKKAINTTMELKKRAVDFVNNKYNLTLYYKGRSKKNEDDAAEAIAIALSFIEENDNQWQEKQP